MRRTVLFRVMGSGGRSRLRVIAAGMALALAVAACSRGGPSDDDVGAIGGEGSDTTAVDGDGSGPTGGAGGGGKTTTTSTRKQTSTTAEGDRGTATTSADDTSTTRPTAQADSGARGAPGAYARTLLQAQRSERIVVELLVQQGAEPAPGTLDHVTSVLRNLSGKPVSLTGPVTLPAGDGTTTDADIRELADRHGRAPQTGEQAVVRLLFLNGRYVPEDSVLGVAVRGDTAAVYPKEVREASTPLVPASALETSVATHEVGHLLGLVDLVLRTGREDPEHEGHSRNRNSVMYWAIESSLVGQFLKGPPPRDFDADDRADLAAIRNGG